MLCSTLCLLFLLCYRHLRDLHSFPTRRSSDLEMPLVHGAGGSVEPGAIGAERAQVLRLGTADPGDRRGGQKERASHEDRKSTRLNSSHVRISYAVFCLKKKKNTAQTTNYTPTE